jgi:hypothetical protein
MNTAKGKEKAHSEGFAMKIRAIVDWLEDHPGLSSWVQALGVIIGITIALVQIEQATDSLKASVENNQIAIRNNASDLLVGINEAALSHPEAGGEYTGHKRLHLMRIHYFYRTFQLHTAGIIDDEAFTAETEYLAWTASLQDFPEVWGNFRLQYSHDFRSWVDTTLAGKKSRPNSTKP